MELNERICQANILWQQGLLAEARGDFMAAYQSYAQAHDLVVTCPVLHQQAHVHLRRVNWALGHYGEWLTDTLLQVFAPLGVFELVARLARAETLGLDVCKRPS